MRAGLPAQGLADLPDQRRIPGRGKRNSRREAGRREAPTKTQVIGVLVVLDPQPVWSVRQPERPEAGGWEGCGRPVVRAGRQNDLLSNGQALRHSSNATPTAGRTDLRSAAPTCAKWDR